MNTSDQINGFPVIATFKFPGDGTIRAGRVVIVSRGSEYGHDFVVAKQFETDGVLDKEWHHGFYHDTIHTAWATFQDIVESQKHKHNNWINTFECPLCGQQITDGKPCGCGAR